MKRYKILGIRGDYSQNEKRRKENELGAVSYYRVAKPLEQIKDHDAKTIGREFETLGNSDEEKMREIFKNDVIFTPYAPNDKMNAWLFSMRDHFKKKIVLDMDDSYLNVPSHNQMYEKFKGGTPDRAKYSAAISLCDAVTVSTEPLKQEMEAHITDVYGTCPPIFVVPNMNDAQDWTYPKVGTDEVTTIGYFGSTSHSKDLEMVLPVIQRLMREYPALRFDVQGMLDADDVKALFSTWEPDLLTRITIFKANLTFKDHREGMARMPWDIGIAPLEDTQFNRCKSHIKWMEYAMYEIPVVASAVYPYTTDLLGRQVIEHGETGLLVKPKEWYSALEKMIVDINLHQQIGQNARKQVIKNWQYKNSEIGDIWNELLLTIHPK